MHLHDDPFSRGSPLLQLAPKALGDVIQNVGTPDFVRFLSDFLNESIAADGVHLERSRPHAKSATGFVTEWMGSGGEQYAYICQVMDLYHRKYSDQDPLLASIRGVLGTQLIQRDVGTIPDSEFKRMIFDIGRVSQECFLSRGTRTVQYWLSLTRLEGRQPFTLTEMLSLRRMGDFLFPLFELHANTAAHRSLTAVRVNLTSLAKFDKRVAAREIRLSRREYEMCKSLLSGMTIPESAGSLDVKPATAESYVKRAYAKLGIRTKWELLQWAHADD